MSFGDILGTLRRRYLWLLVLTVLGGGLGWGVARATPKTFEATTVLFITATDDRNAAALSQGAEYVQNQIRSYPMMLLSPAVLQGVQRDTGLGLDGSLYSRVAAQVPTDSSLLNITVAAGEPGEAAILARAFAKNFSSQIAALETRAGSRTSPIRVTTVEPAVVPLAPTKPVVRNYLMLGLVGGFLLGLVAAVIREVLGRR